jgi:monoamine oxidase
MNLGLPSGLGNGADTVSALDLLREAAHRERSKQVYTIKGGSENLPLAFARRLEDKIIYGAAVVNIFRDANQVTVTFSRSGRQQSLTADRVICAIPFSVLKTIPVTPAFSRRKQRLIQQVQYTSVSRVYLQSRTRFWLDAKQTGQAATDLPIMSVYPRTPNLPGMRGILESYTTGYWSRHMTAMSENERVQTALLYMSLVHPSITKNFEGGASKCWDADRWSRGAYVWFKPGEMVKQIPHIATPEGRVHFAGEHASSWPGWMQGALESGNRAAREVNDAA